MMPRIDYDFATILLVVWMTDRSG
ncbi:hypothetical protein CBM2586_B40072 [Cupriavidus phytorum]|uniref:Uncharacterized protein n=1 Tax=Cupriavidus taiwanensis TaxID=164546 RepID=A0A375CLI0_9BURK|nr:hypothetical protein CBM2586_B40072 [Cupriavidus taiwanensis]